MQSPKITLLHSIPLFSILVISLFCGCAAPSMNNFSSSFSKGMNRCPDLKIVHDGLPTYILMMESALHKTPKDPQLLKAAAELYSFYGSNLIDEKPRAEHITQHALNYSLLAANTRIQGIQEARVMDFDSFEALINKTTKSDVPQMVSLASVWIDWIKVRKDDMSAISYLPNVKMIMEKTTDLDSGYRAETTNLYLALITAMQGADEDITQAYFNDSIKAAGKKNLTPKLFYAIWRRDMGHTNQCRQLLREIIADGIPDASDYKLINHIVMNKSIAILDELE